MDIHTTTDLAIKVTPGANAASKEYWWVLFYTPDEAGNKIDTVVDFHPFTAAKILKMQILDWKPIAEYEYNLWKQLNTQEK